MESELLISFIVPVKNNPLGIDYLVNRYLNSSFSVSSELVIVDDVSDQELCNYEGKQGREINVFRNNRESFGVGLARNIGLRYARGKYISFWDSDDKPCFDGINQVVKFLDNTECDFLSTDFMLNEIPVQFFAEYNSIADMIGDSQLIVAPWAKFYNAEFIKCFQFPIDAHNEDFALFNYLTNNGIHRHLNIITYRYVRTGKGISTDFPAGRINDTIEGIVSIYKSNKDNRAVNSWSINALFAILKNTSLLEVIKGGLVKQILVNIRANSLREYLKLSYVKLIFFFKISK